MVAFPFIPLWARRATEGKVCDACKLNHCKAEKLPVAQGM